MHATKVSDWTFNTSGTIGLSAGFVAGGGGSLSLKDPQGNDETLHYIGIGPGIGVGVDTPGNVGGSIAPGMYPNLGTIMILDGFHGNELSLDDMKGPCAIFEVQASFFVGGSGTRYVSRYVDNRIDNRQDRNSRRPRRYVAGRRDL